VLHKISLALAGSRGERLGARSERGPAKAYGSGG